MSKTRRIWLLSLALGLLVYLGGYLCLRLQHDFVHHATYYTQDGRVVHTDTVSLGEWRWSQWYRFLGDLYMPLQMMEGYAWADHQRLARWREGRLVRTAVGISRFRCLALTAGSCRHRHLG